MVLSSGEASDWMNQTDMETVTCTKWHPGREPSFAYTYSLVVLFISSEYAVGAGQKANCVQMCEINQSFRNDSYTNMLLLRLPKIDHLYDCN